MSNIKRIYYVPPGTFRGSNFMTPTVTDFFKLGVGYAELSNGTGIDREPIFGVTVRPDHLKEGDEKRSKLFWSEAKALAYIDSLS